MKSNIIASVLFLASIFQVNAQKEFQGIAVYESKTTMNEFRGNMGGREITPEMRKIFEERMKKALEKTFILNFDKSASIYKEEEKLEAPGQGGFNTGRIMSMMMGADGTYYKNVKEKTYVLDKEFQGKEFLIKDSLPKLEWKMESETRQIGGYTCYKATAVRQVSEADLRNLRQKKTDDAKDEKKEVNATNFMDAFEMPKEIAITAWYTPEIPVNQGPESYWGLPGLILEVNDGRTTILCSKVVLNAKDKVDIKPSKKGKTVTQKEFDEIVISKRKEMEDMRRNGQGGRNFRMGN